MDRRDLAQKEAGHAVAAVMLGRAFGHVSLDPADCFGSWLADRSGDWMASTEGLAPAQRMKLQDEITIYLAGTRSLASAIGCDDSITVGDSISWARSTTDRLARRYDFGPMVETVATELLRRGRLSYAEVVEVTRSVRDGLDREQMLVAS